MLTMITSANYRDSRLDKTSMSAAFALMSDYDKNTDNDISVSLQSLLKSVLINANRAF